MQISVDFRSGVPIYIQIMEQIKQQVGQGILKPGDQLPTVRQLATDLRVNFNTVARAYRMLDEAGMISTQHGRGTYIWEAPKQDERQKMRMESLVGLTRWYLEEADQSSYSPDDVEAVFQDLLHAWKEGRLRTDPQKETSQEESS
jgi:GntR family transcriptional regulator